MLQSLGSQRVRHDGTATVHSYFQRIEQCDPNSLPQDSPTLVSDKDARRNGFNEMHEPLRDS